MDNLKTSTKILLKELATRYPDQDHFRKSAVVDTGKALGYTGKDWDPILTKDNRVKIGTYDLAFLIEPLRAEVATSTAVVNTIPAQAAQMQSIVNEEKNFASVDSTFIA